MYRQLLVHAVLAILLPTEDLENGCLTALVGQILSELIIGNSVANKLSEPWLILEIISIASTTILRRQSSASETQVPSIKPPDDRRKFSVQSMFWAVFQWLFVAVSFVRTIFTLLMTSSSLPQRSSRGTDARTEVTSHSQQFESFNNDTRPPKTPVLSFRCFSAISNLIELKARMPWLCGALSMVQYVTTTRAGRIAAVDSKIDR